jgi:hypothetical protein
MIQTFTTLPNPIVFSGAPATVGFQVPILVGSVVTSGAWLVTGNPYQSLGIDLSINSTAVLNGISVGIAPSDIATINSGGVLDLSYNYYEYLSFSVTVQATLVGTFPGPPPVTPVFPPWPGPGGNPPGNPPGNPIWPPPSNNQPYPAWPGGTSWPGYSNWEGWSGWGAILTRDTQNNYTQCNRKRGETESSKFNSVVKSSGIDIQTGILQVKYLEFMNNGGLEAAYIANDYAMRQLQHLRLQVSWRANLT